MNTIIIIFVAIIFRAHFCTWNNFLRNRRSHTYDSVIKDWNDTVSVSKIRNSLPTASQKSNQRQAKAKNCRLPSVRAGNGLVIGRCWAAGINCCCYRPRQINQYLWGYLEE